MTIDYEMAEGPAGWKVYDVKVAGVSLVITYRESFAAIVRDAGIDGLIKALSDKNRPYAQPSSAAENDLAASNGRELARSQVHVRRYDLMAAQPA